MMLLLLIAQLRPTLGYYWEDNHWFLHMFESAWFCLFFSIFMLYTVLILRALLKYMRG